MKIWTFIFSLLSFSNIWAAEILVLKLGESKLLRGSGKAWVENGQVLRLAEAPGGFQVKSLRPGNSLVRIGDHEFQVSSLSVKQNETYALLKEALKQTLGLKLQVQQNEIRIHGHLLRWADWEKVFSLCDEMSVCDFHFSAKISKSLQPEIQKSLRDLFLKRGLSPITFVFGRPWTAMVPEDHPQKEELLLTLKPLGVKPLMQKGALTLLPSIRVWITVAEVRRAEMKKWGVDWPSQYTAQILPDNSWSRGNLEASLSLLEQNGSAKVLASPNLLCRSGKEAEFFAGGEIPIKVIHFKQQDILWKRYGVILKVKPVADYTGRISLSIETEVSTLDEANKIDGIPGVLANRIQSHFDLSESKTIALSGLIKAEESTSVQGLPALQHIPVLGRLFSSEEFRDRRTELVIFVRPEVLLNEGWVNDRP